VYSTNLIEGGGLSENETDEALRADPDEVAEYEKRRALNIKAAYDFAIREAVKTDWKLSCEFIVEVHRLISHDLPTEKYRPGVLRDNPKDCVTHVGDQAHGGKYKPPQNGKDVRLLLGELINWHDAMVEEGVNPLIRAPLVHLYYELIHPFWDGNGRVGRVVEATILLSAGYRYAPFALARYYLNHIDSYFTLFNTCRKSLGKGSQFPNQPFVSFYLEGMRATIKHLHKRANKLVGIILFQASIGLMLEKKDINSRQYTVLTQLLKQGPSKVGNIRHEPWYVSLYLKLNDKTRYRDMTQLRELKLIRLDEEDVIWLSCW
jgi:Fic family protein